MAVYVSADNHASKCLTVDVLLVVQLTPGTQSVMWLIATRQSHFLYGYNQQ